MQCHTQSDNITTNLKDEVYFNLTTFSVTNVLTWKYYVNDSTKGKYYMILGRDLLTYLELNLKFCDHGTENNDEPFKGYT